MSCNFPMYCTTPFTRYLFTFVWSRYNYNEAIHVAGCLVERCLLHRGHRQSIFWFRSTQITEQSALSFWSTTQPKIEFVNCSMAVWLFVVGVVFLLDYCRLLYYASLIDCDTCKIFQTLLMCQTS